MPATKIDTSRKQTLKRPKQNTEATQADTYNPIHPTELIIACRHHIGSGSKLPSEILGKTEIYPFLQGAQLLYAQCTRTDMALARRKEISVSFSTSLDS